MKVWESDEVGFVVSGNTEDCMPNLFNVDGSRE